MSMLSSKMPAPLVTREHGSWAVLLVPILASLGVVGKWNADLLWFALCALAVFLCYIPAQRLLRHWGGALIGDEKLREAKVWGGAYGIAAVALVALLLSRGYWGLLPIGATGGFFFALNFCLVKARGKSQFSDLAAVAGLTLTGLGSYEILEGSVDARGLALYVVNVLFFGCGVFYVHMQMRATSLKNGPAGWKAKLSVARDNLLYHSVVVVVVGILFIVGSVPPVFLLAFAPMVLYAVYGSVRLSGRAQYKKVGLALLGLSLLFAFLLSCGTWV